MTLCDFACKKTIYTYMYDACNNYKTSIIIYWSINLMCLYKNHETFDFRHVFPKNYTYIYILNIVTIITKDTAVTN